MRSGLETAWPRMDSPEGVEGPILEPGTGERYFIRMNLQERVQHWVLILSFSLLVLTGLPLIFYDWGVFRMLIDWSFELRGWLHRLGAVLLIGLAVWHTGYMLGTARGRRILRDMAPERKDIRDALEALMHNLGIASWLYRRGLLAGFLGRHPYLLFREPPKYGRYNFIEKFEYWAVVWGTAVMILTGFFMWQIEFAMELFPRYVFDVFVAVHSYEAILAFLAIIIWHMYTVHLSPATFPMNRVWWNGRISEEKMMEEHPLEYESITAMRGREKS